MRLISDVEQIDRKQWRTLLSQSSVASVFQSPEMFDFWRQYDAAKVTICGVEEKDRLVGIVVCVIHAEGNGLKQKLTSRAIIDGGPLLDDHISEEALVRLLDAVKTQLKRRCVYIETRNLNDYSPWKNTFESCGFDYKPHYNFHIDTTSVEEMEKRMDRGRRRRIKKAVEHQVEVSNDAKEVKNFYDLLHDLYHNKIHKPLPKFELFEKLTQAPFAKYFFIKDVEGRVIGGQLILMLDHRVAYAWYCCGLDKEYRDYYPSIMANYVAIRYAAENGFPRYDMMGAGSPDKDYGVRDFKAQFGGTLVEHGRFLKINNYIVYNSGKLYLSLINLLRK